MDIYVLSQVINGCGRIDYGNVTRQYFAANTKTLIVVRFRMAQVYLKVLPLILI